MENTSEKEKNKLIRTLKQLPNYIEVIKTYKVGKDFAKRQTCYDYGLVAEFDNVRDLETYLDHPVHKEFLQRAIPYIGKLAEIDFVVK